MKNSLYVIEYEYHHEPKSFIIRAEVMNNAEAWHWACCDAGIGIIPRSRNEKIKRISKPLAERYGLENVRWRPSGEYPVYCKALCAAATRMNVFLMDGVHAGGGRGEARVYCFLRRSCNILLYAR